MKGKYEIAERAYATAGNNGKGTLFAKRLPTVTRSLKTGEPPRLEEIDLHPLVESFPPASDEQIARLAQDIRLIGSTAPFALVVDWGEKHKKSGIWFLIDDRNRFAASQLAGVKIEFRAMASIQRIELLDLAARLSLPDSHLTESQRAAIAVPFAEQFAKDGKPRRTAGLRQGGGESATKTSIPANPPVGPKLAPRGNGAGDGSGGAVERFLARNPDARADRCAERAAELFHVSTGYIKQAAQIRREDPELFEQVRLNRDLQGNPINLSQARLRLHKSKQRSLINSLLSNEKYKARNADEIIRIGDCLEILPTLARRKFKLVFWDPPYNNGFRYNADPFPEHPDRLNNDDYFRLVKAVLCELVDLLTPDGSLFVMIDDNYSDFFGMFLREMRQRLVRRNTIIWLEKFTNYSKSDFSPVRFIHHFDRSKNRTWNAEEIFVPSDRQEKYGDARANPNGRLPDNVWDFPRLVGNDPLRAPFGERSEGKTEPMPPQVHPGVLQRIIKVASNPGDWILDPMCGNGGFLLEGLKLDRRVLGIERSAKYADQSRRWIASRIQPEKTEKTGGGKA